MYRNHSVGVVVPAYNEESFVGDVVADLPAFVDAVYLVDDASTDGTWSEMGEVMATRSDAGTDALDTVTGSLEHTPSIDDRVAEAETVGNVVRLRHRENRGAGGAVKTGYLAALADGVDVIATIDGDGQMDAGRLTDVLDPVVDGQAGYAKGNRFAGTDVFGEMPPFRLFGNLLLTGLTRIASGYWRLRDPQNGFTAVSREALIEVDVAETWEYYGYMNQLIARFNAANVRIADVPMPATYGYEESGIVHREYVRRVSQLLIVSFVRRLSTKYAGGRSHPVVVGYAVGTLSAIAVLLGGLRSIIVDGKAPGLREVAGGVAVSLAAFAAAGLLDRETEPVVVDATNEEQVAPQEDAEVANATQ